MIGRIRHALGAPYRWADRRGRIALATDALARTAAALGPRGEVELRRDEEGLVGTVDMARGGIEVRVQQRGYLVAWTGREDHAHRFESVGADDDSDLRAMLDKWTSGWWLAERMPRYGEI